MENKHPEPLYIAESQIHGKGLFTNQNIKKGIRIVLVADMGLFSKVPNWITPMGSMINHSKKGNTYLEQEGNYFYLVGLRDIAAGEELTSDYTIAPEYFSRKIDGFKEI